MKKIFTSLSIFSILLFVNNASAQGETCATAIPVVAGIYTSNGPTSGNGASVYSGGVNSDWYSYTAQSDGLVTISSCGSGGDSWLLGFIGTCSNLVNVIDSDDDCGSNEFATYPISSGTTLYFEWSDSYDDSPVAFAVSFNSAVITPAGENCADATAISEGGVIISDGPITGNGASAYSGDQHSDWYSFTPNITDTYTISSCGSGGDSKLYVFDGSCAALNNIADNDDECGVNETVSLILNGGTTYFVEWTNAYSNNPVTFSIIGATASLEEEEINNVSIYPNPTSDGIFSVDFDGMEGVTKDVKVLNSLGQSVYESSSSSIVKVDISEQPAGLYFVIVNANGMSSSKKIVKK
ncbi:T9SS type A sorting domain-containing protein [Brumimicrobium mesophilum]|uniref:T9SS type A sorting domain-containing protein n=1 Tax=Brumimicrobium mesophilum TaxID=392717 RepID=UPI000D142B25|nr:T9SS type A sorting domain-containing protein [Brumimicrobium mesophilum]